MAKVIRSDGRPKMTSRTLKNDKLLEWITTWSPYIIDGGISHLRSVNQ